jgi:hypothetical protein
MKNLLLATFLLTLAAIAPEFIYLLTEHATIHQHSIQRELAQLKARRAA